MKKNRKIWSVEFIKKKVPMGLNYDSQASADKKYFQKVQKSPNQSLMLYNIGHECSQNDAIWSNRSSPLKKGRAIDRSKQRNDQKEKGPKFQVMWRLPPFATELWLCLYIYCDL
eukprot:TRINITY_DN83576_c0_g1_i1.p1 TRINITY_DN83576_c0_g1~~TRINITY_DN83576_c0_g1_i1.p1  ORF type:complete len:114 (-),score=3.48 TRINITY_DN83576_c0_g1_i1:11-352(-)